MITDGEKEKNEESIINGEDHKSVFKIVPVDLTEQTAQ